MHGALPRGELYFQVLEEADSRVYVNREPTRNCMMDRNHFMIDHSSILLAVCKNVKEQRDGTAATIRYAQRTGKEIILLHPLTLHITHEDPLPHIE